MMIRTQSIRKRPNLFIFVIILFAFLVEICNTCPACENQEDPAMEGVHVPKTESESSPPTSANSEDVKQEESVQEAKSTQSSKVKGDISAHQKYKALFEQHRASQVTNVKALINFGKNEQRYQLVQLMLNQLFKILGEAKQNVTVMGYLPGDPIPEEEKARDSVSKVLENTALFGDLVLHMPEAVHSMYDKQLEWHTLLSWCYGFCLESGVFDGPHKKLLNLMAQEVDIIPKAEDYVNPFKDKKYPVNNDRDIGDEDRKESGNKRESTQDAPSPFPAEKEKKKKPRKKLKRGPKLSHTEL